MKLLDVMKKYDRCVVRESAKLTKIYKLLIKESEEADDIEEAECPECNEDSCKCESDKGIDECGGNEVEEADEMMTAEEFFAEADDEVEESDDEVEEADDEVEEADDEVEESDDEVEEADDEVEESDDEVEEADDEVEEVDDEKKLEESLKSYRRTHHHLFTK